MDGMVQPGAGLSEEHRMVRDLVVKFVERELMPLEPAVLRREAEGQRYGLTPEEEGPLPHRGWPAAPLPKNHK